MKALRAILLSACCAFSVAACAAGAMTAAAAEPTWMDQPACQTLDMAATGGPAPTGDVAVMRYIGSSNYELSYRGTVILFDAEYETRIAPNHDLGVKDTDLKKATAIYIGHGHSDHMASAHIVSAASKAPVYGAKLTIDAPLKMGVAKERAMTVKNGDVQKYPGFTIETILAQHASVMGADGKLNPRFEASMKAWGEMRKAAGIDAPVTFSQMMKGPDGTDIPKGTSDAHVLDQGTLGFLVTFDTGYTMLVLDSAGPVTEAERAVVKRLGRVDFATISYQGFFVPQRQIEMTLPLIELFNPRVFQPDHHDESGGIYPDMAGYPLFMAIREKLPATRGIAPLYRAPTCINTKTKDVFVGDTWTWPQNKGK